MTNLCLERFEQNFCCTTGSAHIISLQIKRLHEELCKINGAISDCGYIRLKVKTGTMKSDTKLKPGIFIRLEIRGLMSDN